MDVVGQRLERRDVNNLRRIGQAALDALANEIVNRREESRERLARTGGRGDQRVLAGLDGGPGFDLRGGGRGESLIEPCRDSGMEEVSPIVCFKAACSQVRPERF